MSNDLRIVQALLARKAISHNTSGNSEGTIIKIKEGTMIKTEEGYISLYVVFEFDKFDTLTKIGAYE